MGSYWDNRGSQQQVIDHLQSLVPSKGEADDPLVEITRLLINANHDLHNNGGGNEARWQFVDAINTLLSHKALTFGAGIEKLAADLKQSVKQFREGMTLVGCHIKDRHGLAGVEAFADKALDDLAALTIELIDFYGYSLPTEAKIKQVQSVFSPIPGALDVRL